MPVEAANMSVAKPFTRLTLALIGAEKSGKSRLAATARKPILHLDFDNRRESISGSKDVYALTLIDRNPSVIQPDAYPTALSVMTMIEQGATLKTIGMQYGAADWPDVKPRTIVNDSLATLSQAARNYAMYTNKDLRRTIHISGQPVYIPYSYDTWNAETASVETFLMRQLAIPTLDVIVIFHETQEEAPDSTNEKVKLTGKITVYPARYKGLIKYFNEVWRVSRETSTIPTIQLLPDFRFTAATNLDFSKLQPHEVKPDISFLIEKATGGV